MTRICLLIFLWHNVVAWLDLPHACFISGRLAVLAPLFFGERNVGLSGLVISELEIQTGKVCLQSGVSVLH